MTSPWSKANEKSKARFSLFTYLSAFCLENIERYTLRKIRYYGVSFFVEYVSLFEIKFKEFSLKKYMPCVWWEVLLFEWMREKNSLIIMMNEWVFIFSIFKKWKLVPSCVIKKFMNSILQLKIFSKIHFTWFAEQKSYIRICKK